MRRKPTKATPIETLSKRPASLVTEFKGVHYGYTENARGEFELIWMKRGTNGPIGFSDYRYGNG